MEKKDYSALMDEFPILFRDRKRPMSETCMCWGIGCGPGWYTPLYNLCCKLESLNEFFFKQHGFVVKADQVKEKFGLLCFYWSFDRADGDAEWTEEFNNFWNDLKRVHLRNACYSLVDRLVIEAEDECFCTCEDCGRQIGADWSPRYETSGWVSYICEDCLKKKQNENPALIAKIHYTDTELSRIKYCSPLTYARIIEEIEKQSEEHGA